MFDSYESLQSLRLRRRRRPQSLIRLRPGIPSDCELFVFAPLFPEREGFVSILGYDSATSQLLAILSSRGTGVPGGNLSGARRANPEQGERGIEPHLR